MASGGAPVRGSTGLWPRLFAVLPAGDLTIPCGRPGSERQGRGHAPAQGSSGSGPVPARRFAAMWPGSAVPGMAQVTAGWETTYFTAGSRPRSCSRSPGVIRQRRGSEAAQEPAAAEGPVDQNRDPLVRRERQQALLRRPVVEGVVDLEEVQPLGLQDRLDGVVGALGIVRDAEIADPSSAPSIPAGSAGGRASRAGCGSASGRGGRCAGAGASASSGRCPPRGRWSRPWWRGTDARGG